MSFAWSVYAPLVYSVMHHDAPQYSHACDGACCVHMHELCQIVRVFWCAHDALCVAVALC